MVLEIQALVASGCREQQNDWKDPEGLFWNMEIVSGFEWWSQASLHLSKVIRLYTAFYSI